MGRVKKRLLDRLISCETGKIFQAMAVAGYDANHFIKYPGRSGHRSCSFKIAVRKSFWKFTGKHLRWSNFLIKLYTLRTPFLQSTSRRLLLPRVKMGLLLGHLSPQQGSCLAHEKLIFQQNSVLLWKTCSKFYHCIKAFP